ncbi:MAG: gamma-butyrobetaine hydroxylase-like domain-containing protein, partial [Acidocella sp.]|nr:gamma-butyrobetaine hydroxylase-like domain-containing protein [Acidocella sp.]
EIGFEDGSTISLPAEFLRVQSLSASGRAELVSGKRLVSIIAAEPIGNYALRLRFSDGHNTGVYSWDYLRQLDREYNIRWRRYLHLLEETGLSRE